MHLPSVQEVTGQGKKLTRLEEFSTIFKEEGGL